VIAPYVATPVVLEGASSIDESMLTGESMPVLKTAGLTVIAGTVNTTGSLVIQAKKIGHNTLLAHIVRQVSEAGRSRAPIQRIAAEAITLSRAVMP